MYYKDLHCFPAGHPPSPYDWPPVIRVEGGGIAYGGLPRCCRLIAIGWLEGDKPLSTGPVPDDFVEKLIEAHESGKTICDGSKGNHECSLCEPAVRWPYREVDLRGYGHHLVRLGTTVYMCPEMILHYVGVHRYSPPNDFVRAVVEGSFLSDVDLVAIPIRTPLLGLRLRRWLD